MATIAASIRKTRKALIVEECMKTGGIGASLSAQISESLFDELDHQVSLLAVQSPMHEVPAFRPRSAICSMMS
jgi:pyruvate dehydrogenase E1 component beta subunit